MRRLTIPAVLFALVLGSCAGTSEDTTTTQAPAGAEEATTTTSAETTTTRTVLETTTTVAETTTTVAAAEEVPVTPVVGVLAAYNEGGEMLFPSGSVEAHWYQADGHYVAVYRGFDASAGTPMCPGNSIYDGAGWIHVTNSPLNGTVGEICNAAPMIAEPPMGAYTCGSLLYYLTAIPVAQNGYLYGTLELSTATETIGHTSQVLTDAPATPEFPIGLTAYSLPAAGVEDAYTASC